MVLAIVDLMNPVLNIITDNTQAQSFDVFARFLMVNQNMLRVVIIMTVYDVI